MRLFDGGGDAHLERDRDGVRVTGRGDFEGFLLRLADAVRAGERLLVAVGVWHAHFSLVNSSDELATLRGGAGKLPSDANSG